MNRIYRWSLILTAFFLFSSCGSLPGYRYETVSSLPEGLSLPDEQLLLETVQVRRTESPLSYAITAREAVEAVCRRYGVPLTRNQNCRFSLSLWVMEKRISLVLEPRYEVTAVLRVLDRNTGKPVFHLLYTGESERSIRSLYRFFTVTDRVVERTVSELYREEADVR